MRAIYYERHGDVDTLIEGDWPAPKVKAKEVLVQVQYMGLNPLDYRLRRGEMRALTLWHRRRLVGSDFSGEVREVGQGVQGYSPGDRVYGMVNQVTTGTSAELISVPVNHLYHAPETLDPAVSAGVPLAALTALQALKNLGKVKRGDAVLINGASGGVGHFAVQLAAHYGAQVTAVTSTRNLDWMSELGASAVIDYTREEFIHRTDAFDIVFDCYGNRAFHRCRRCMTERGVYITTIPSVTAASRTVLNPFRNQAAKFVLVRSRASDLERLHTLIDEGAIKPRVEQSFIRDQIQDAYRHLESKRTRGKLTVRMTT